MDLEDLRRIGDGARLSVFRLETLPQYLVPQETDEFADQPLTDYCALNSMALIPTSHDSTTKRSREMALVRLSGDCNDETSPGLWDEDQTLEDVIAVVRCSIRRRCRSARAKSRSGFPDA